jgi:hypothetical protein
MKVGRFYPYGWGSGGVVEELLPLPRRWTDVGLAPPRQIDAVPRRDTCGVPTACGPFGPQIGFNVPAVVRKPLML